MSTKKAGGKSVAKVTKKGGDKMTKKSSEEKKAEKEIKKE